MNRIKPILLNFIELNPNFASNNKVNIFKIVQWTIEMFFTNETEVDNKLRIKASWVYPA